jgi:putative phosphoesterase
MLLGIISDAHGHGRAFKLGIDLLLKQGVELTYFLGDAVGYFPSPSVVRQLMNGGDKIRCILGNHEEMLLNKTNDESKIYRLKETRASLTKVELEFIKSWSTYLELSADGNKLLFVHGTYKEPQWGYLYPDGEAEGSSGEYDFIFQGNTHWPMVRRDGEAQIINPGSCSLPRDNGALGSVATFDTKTRATQIFRFSISDANRELLEDFPDTDSEVAALFSRVQADYAGEFIV